MKLHNISVTPKLVEKVKDKTKATSFFVVQAVGRIISGRSVGKIIIIIILSVRVGKSKNKNINHRGKETCA